MMNLETLKLKLNKNIIKTNCLDKWMKIMLIKKEKLMINIMKIKNLSKE